jgi:hypothetical protein
MIIEWLNSIAMGFVGWLGGLMPHWDAPTDSPSGAFAQIVQVIAGMGVWIPWPVLILCTGIVVAAWLVTLSVMLLRAVIAHVPLFGGAGD